MGDRNLTDEVMGLHHQAMYTATWRGLLVGFLLGVVTGIGFGLTIAVWL